MPSVTAVPYPNLGRVLVDLHWGDVSASSCAQVVRVVETTGVETPLRAYVYPCPQYGEYITLSGGRAVLWDTEAPLDTAFHYRTQAGGYPLAPEDIRDTFSRTKIDSWGTSDSLHPWTIDSSPASEADVTGGVGTMSLGSVGADRRFAVGGLVADVDAVVAVRTPVLALTQPITLGVFARWADASNFYRGSLAFNPAGTVSGNIVKRVAGVDTTLTTGASGLTYVANEWFWLRVQATGTTLRLRTWKVGTAEPGAWLLTTTDSVFTVGRTGVRGTLEAGNTNVLPVVAQWDNFHAVETGPVAVSETLTLPSDGGLWLRDPVRPCNDQRLELCFGANQLCLPGAGIFFVELGQEEYPNQGTLVAPFNARRPLSTARQRRDSGAPLTLATRTFADRDALVTLLKPGGDLLLSAPPDYGMPDRYMSVETVEVARLMPDHRYQPRLHRLPYVTVDRPVGTTQGVCGSRFTDLCSGLYDTWDELAAAGLTGVDLLVGAAGGVFGTGWRDWLDVETGFATWAAVEANGTWADLKERT